MVRNIYNLYKNVFNNITISKIIWEKVRFEDDNEELYNQELSNLISTQELTIESLLSNKQYSLFNDYIDYYLRVVINNDKSSKYWKHQIFELSKRDIELLLSYKSLGIKRFKLIYKHFGKHFKSYGNIVLLNAAKSGDFKIYQFLVSQGYELPEKVPRLYSKLECGGNIEVFTEHYNFYNSSLNKQDPDELSCLFQYFIESNQPLMYTSLMMNLPDSCGDKTHLLLLGLALKYSDCKLIDRAFNFYGKEKLAIKNLKDIKFVKSKRPYQTERYHGSFIDTYSSLIGSKTTHIIDFKTFMYYLSKFGNGRGFGVNNSQDKEILNFLDSVELKNYSFENSNYYKPLMVHKLFNYYPTFQEFKKLTTEKTLDFKCYGVNLLEKLSIHISNELFDIEYMDYFLKYVFGQKKEKKIDEEKYDIEESKDEKEDQQDESIGFQIPVQVLDTKFEMVEFLFNNYRDKLTTKEMLMKFDLYNNKNSFFGDVRSARFYLSQIPISPTNKFYSLENGLMGMSVKNGNLELVKFYISIKRFSKDLTIKNLTTLLFGCKLNENHFEIFKFLVLSSSSSSPISNNSQYQWLLNNKEDFYLEQLCKNLNFNYFIQSFYIKNSGKSNLEFNGLLEKDDYQLFKLYPKYNDCKSIPQIQLSKLFENSNYKILNYFVNQLNVKPSNSISDNKSTLFKNLFNSDKKRLCWFIENDIDFIIKNVDNLIEISCDNQQSYYLNLILLQSSSSSPSSISNEWKLNLLIKVLKLSISFSKNEKKEDLKEIKKEKKEKKVEKEFDPYEYNSSDEESSSDEEYSDDEMVEADGVDIKTPDETIPWILKLQFNNSITISDKQSNIKSLLNKKELISISRYYLEIIQPNLNQYKKLNSNIIDLIECLQ